MNVWFWQRIVTPHMTGLASALAELGHSVTYIAERLMSEDRERLGWKAPSLHPASLVLAGTSREIERQANAAPDDTVHICQGIRRNGLVAVAQRKLRERKAREWIIMEGVEDAGLLGLLRRVEYRRLLISRCGHVQGFLANGYRTKPWLTALGVRPSQVHKFAYFLPAVSDIHTLPAREDLSYRLIFVGQIIKRKRLDLLLKALAKLPASVHLDIVGCGPEERELRRLTEGQLGRQVRWLGQLQSAHVPAAIARADCLVLPSRHDGWGAVASEAMLVGTPVVCSDTCGVAGAVRASDAGEVFENGNEDALVRILYKRVHEGMQTQAKRARLIAWAHCLSAPFGAKYLESILQERVGSSDSPELPW